MQDGVATHRKYDKYLIPYSWWEPFIAWLNNLKWTAHGLKDNGTVCKHCMRCTWTELTIAFQIVSGFKLDKGLDLYSQERIVKTIFRKIANSSKSTSAGKRCAAAEAWAFGPSTSLKVITGQLRLGMLSRHILSDHILE